LGLPQLNAQTTFEGKIVLDLDNPARNEKAQINWLIKNGNHKLTFESKIESQSYDYYIVFPKGSSNMEMVTFANGQSKHYSIPLSETVPPVPITHYEEVTNTGRKKKIGGFDCEEVLLKSADQTSFCWITKDSELSMTDLPQMMQAGNAIATLKVKGFKGFPMALSTYTMGGELLYSQEIRYIQIEQVSDSEFEIVK